MVISNDPNYEKNRANKARLNESEESIKERLLTEMRSESVSIITLALMYAKNFEETGEDVTTRWATADQQTDALQRYYDKGYKLGYQDGIKSGREYEQRKMEKMLRKRGKT